MSWKIETLSLPKPDEFNIDPVVIAREDRTASGKLVKDIIAKKKAFTLSYNGLSAVDVRNIAVIYNINRPITFEYEDEGEIKTATAWFNVFSKTRLHSREEYYQVNIVLEEQ